MGRPKKIKKVEPSEDIILDPGEETEVILEISEETPEELVQELSQEYAVVQINGKDYKRWTDANGVTFTESMDQV